MSKKTIDDVIKAVRDELEGEALQVWIGSDKNKVVFSCCGNLDIDDEKDFDELVQRCVEYCRPDERAN